MNGRPAELGRRVLAYLIDGAIAGVIGGTAATALVGIAFATGGEFPLVLAIGLAYAVVFAWFFVYTFMQAGSGSIGMRLLGLELVHDDGERLGFGRALGRNLVWAAGSAIVVGIFSPLFDASPWRRGWHDKVSGAVMTDVRGVPAARPAAPTGTPAAPPLPTASTGGSPFGAPATLPPGMPAAPMFPRPQAAPVPPPPVATPPAGVVPVAPAPAVAPAAPAAPAVPPRPPQPAAAPVPEDGLIAFVPGITSTRPPARPESRAVAPDEVPVDETRMSTGARAFATLVWDDGARHALYGRTLFGRNPTPETGAHVVPIRDETLSLSKTHFEIGSDDGSLWVLDRHSTNGVLLRRGAQTQAAVAGQRTTLYAGDVLEIGDRRITVEVGR